MVLYEVALPLELPVKGDVLSCGRCAWDDVLFAKQLGVLSLLGKLTTVQSTEERQHKGKAIMSVFIVAACLPQWTRTDLKTEN